MSLLLQLLSVIDSTSLKPEQILTHRISYCPSRHPGSAPFTGGGGKELEALSGKESVAKLGLEPRLWSSVPLALIPHIAGAAGALLAPLGVSKCPLTPTEKK